MMVYHNCEGYHPLDMQLCQILPRTCNYAKPKYILGHSNYAKDTIYYANVIYA